MLRRMCPVKVRKLVVILGLVAGSSSVQSCFPLRRVNPADIEVTGNSAGIGEKIAFFKFKGPQSTKSSPGTARVQEMKALVIVRQPTGYDWGSSGGGGGIKRHNFGIYQGTLSVSLKKASNPGKGTARDLSVVASLDGRKKTILIEQQTFDLNQGNLFILTYDQEWKASLVQANKNTIPTTLPKSIQEEIKELIAGKYS